MKVEFDKNIYSEELHSLNKLWYILEDQHQFFIKKETDIVTLKSSAWYAQSNQTVKKIIDEFIIESSQSSKSEKANISVSKTSTDDIFSIEEAIRYLRQPLIVLLENSFNDGHFIECLIREYKNDSEKIRRAFNNGNCKYGMSGGANTIPDVIKGELKSFQNLPKPAFKYLRFFILIDSDRKYKDMPLNQDKVNIINFLTEHGLDGDKIHVLEKKEVENYLPQEVFSEIENNENYIQAYLRLKDPVQKDFIDIEKGFPDKNFDTIELEEFRQLFSSVDDDDKKIFRKNNLKFVDKGGKALSFKSEFPKLFGSNLVTQRGLIERTRHQLNSNELQDILKKITNLL